MEIDRSNLASDETLTLILSSDDHLTINPDLTPLKKDFVITGTVQNSQFNIINGATKMLTQWQITLLPKHTGEIPIPSISVGRDRTPMQLIHVVPIKKSTSLPGENGNIIFMEAAVIPKEAFIQEQFVYTIKLYFNQSIENPYLSPPDLANAKINQNGQDIIYSKIKNGRYYRVLERSYLITPTKTGNFEIISPVFKGYLNTAAGIDLYGFSNSVLKPVEIQGKSLVVHVKPKPAGFTGQWFPAKKVTVSETWETSALREGEPITRNIIVMAEGATGDQIPELVIDPSPNINFYPEKPVRETKANDQKEMGKLTQKIVYIPTQSGRLRLSGIKVHWWNTSSKKEQIAAVPSKTIFIQSGLLNQNSSDNQVQKLASPTPSQVKKYNLTSVKNHGPLAQYFWPVIAMILLLIWLVTIGLWRRQLKCKVNNPPLEKQRNILKKLEQACLDNDPRSAKRLFLIWGKFFWPDAEIHSLIDIFQHMKNNACAEFEAEIMQLEAIFYRKNKFPWNGAAFWTAFNQYLSLLNNRKTEAKEEALPSLYGESCENS